MTTTTLTPTEADHLVKLESLIERNLNAWEATAKALAVIRDQRLYRDVATTFAEYLEKRWGMTASRAYQLIAGAQVQADVNLRLTEKQARVLAPVPPEQRQAALDAAGGATASLANLEIAANDRRPRRRSGKIRKPKPQVIRGPGWKVTIERKTEQPSLEEIATQLLHQVTTTKRQAA